MAKQALPTDTDDPRAWRIRTQFLTDDEGNRVAVQIPIDDFERLLDDLDDLYDARAVDAACSQQEPGRPLSEFLEELAREPADS